MKDTPPQSPPPTGAKPGAPSRVGLREIIQMECQESNSSILEIFNESEQGRVFIENGKIVHAAINKLKGTPALAKLLALPGGSFELAPFMTPEERTLSAPWTALLQQALRTGEEPAPAPAARSAGPGVAVGKAGGVVTRVAETFICSPAGKILYQAECGDAAGRAAWLKTVTEHARQLGKILPLGQFDRMDISHAQTRIVSRFRADSQVYLRTTRGQAKA